MSLHFVTSYAVALNVATLETTEACTMYCFFFLCCAQLLQRSLMYLEVLHTSACAQCVVSSCHVVCTVVAKISVWMFYLRLPLSVFTGLFFYLQPSVGLCNVLNARGGGKKLQTANGGASHHHKPGPFVTWHDARLVTYNFDPGQTCR